MIRLVLDASIVDGMDLWVGERNLTSIAVSCVHMCM